MASLTLSITALEGAPGWRAEWSLDAATVGSPFTVGERSAEEINSLARDFQAVFAPDALGQRRRPLADPNALRGMGRALLNTWFAPGWNEIGARVAAGPHRALIRSADPAALNLPWELVEIGDGLPLGCDAAWSLRRTPLGALAPGSPLDPGPLRVVFLASAPLDRPCARPSATAPARPPRSTSWACSPID